MRAFIPHWLRALSAELGAQDVRGTFGPAFQVLQDRHYTLASDTMTADEVVQTFLTRRAADEYIAEHKDDLLRPRVQTISLHGNAEMLRLRDWILNLQREL